MAGVDPVNWLKDNLILILAVVCIGLAGGWAINHYKAKSAYNALETKFTTVELDAKNAREANASNQTTISELRAENEKIIAQRAIDEQKIRAAEGNLAALRVALDKQTANNAELRRRLAEENPDVDAYLRDGMPCELARSVWGSEAGYCSN